MDLNNTLTFGGINSATYGIYIDGSGVFNSPERDVTMVTIPNRNGQLSLDNGRFENIEVTYNAFVTENNGKTMAENIRDFRNAIGALKGYQRLSDTYHTDEFRMGVFRNGIEVEPVIYQTGGAFEVTFDCKPQRFLVSGETALTPTSGSTVANATAFDSAPLLEIKGTGNISLNGKSVSINNATIGHTNIVDTTMAPNPTNIVVYLITSTTNTGDTITASIKWPVGFLWYGSDLATISGVSVSGTAETKTYNSSTGSLTPNISATFTKGTYTNKTAIYTVTLSGGLNTATAVVTYTITYTANNVMVFDVSFTKSGSGAANLSVVTSNASDIAWTATVEADSTKTVNSESIFIDLDICESYYFDGNNNMVSVNNIVSIPATPPTLPSGGATITFDNTITSMKLYPRWWRI